jgi:ribosome-binding protein aMBF1 (putative translation factor)
VLLLVQTQLVGLQEQHATEVTQLQASSSKQLSQHVKTADRIIKELEATASSLQQQLASEVERAEGYNQALKR